MRLPEINLRELEKIKKENFKGRLEFQDWYVKWSAAQKAVINRNSADTIKRPSYNISATHARYAKRRSKN